MAKLLKRRRTDAKGDEHKADAYVFGNAVGERLDSIKTAWRATCRRRASRTCTSTTSAARPRVVGSKRACRSITFGTCSGTRTSARRAPTWRSRRRSSSGRCRWPKSGSESRRSSGGQATSKHASARDIEKMRPPDRTREASRLFRQLLCPDPTEVWSERPSEDTRQSLCQPQRL